ncbi:hypothetical protein G9A89_014408 [Geosiphon pyriformis]|nr:hypothetical protein G9A89_014408 [Geosiphon pyriformis]
MKKIIKDSGSNKSFRPVSSRKKRKSGALEKGVEDKKKSTKMPSGYSWSSETGDTTEFDSIDIEKEYLVEETSFDYSKNSVFVNENLNQMLKEPNIKTKKTLGKPLGKINFSSCDNNNDVLSNALLELSSLLINLVNISVRKSFILDIELNKVVDKTA